MGAVAQREKTGSQGGKPQATPAVQGTWWHLTSVPTDARDRRVSPTPMGHPRPSITPQRGSRPSLTQQQPWPHGCPALDTCSSHLPSQGSRGQLSPTDQPREAARPTPSSTAPRPSDDAPVIRRLLDLMITEVPGELSNRVKGLRPERPPGHGGTRLSDSPTPVALGWVGPWFTGPKCL